MTKAGLQERINVLHFGNEPVRGGAEEHMLMLVRNIDRRRFRLHLVCPREVLEKFGADLPDDVDAVPLMFDSPIRMSAAFQFARILRSRRIDVVHSHMFRASLAASPVARACGVPVTVETAHVREDWRRGWIKSSYFMDRLAGGCVSEYIAVSGAIRKYLIEEKRLPATKISAIPNGCDVDCFNPGHPVPTKLRTTLRFGESDPIIVVAARLEPQKGHGILLQALPDVRREFPNVRVVCIGDGGLRSELEQLSHSLGLNESVRFVGYQSNVRDWLALADFAVLPSFYEGLPLTAIESLAAGRTIVATNVDGTPEVVVHEKTGLIVAPGDAASLADAINRLLRDSELRQTLSAAGRKWVVENFNQKRQVRQTEELYLRALERTVSRPAMVQARSQHDY